MDYSRKYIKYKTKYNERKRLLKGGKFPEVPFHHGDKLEDGKLINEPMPFMDEQKSDVMCFNNDKHQKIYHALYDVASCRVVDGICTDNDDTDAIPDIVCLKHSDIHSGFTDISMYDEWHEIFGKIENPNSTINITKNVAKDKKPVFITGGPNFSKVVVKINPIINILFLWRTYDEHNGSKIGDMWNIYEIANRDPTHFNIVEIASKINELLQSGDMSFLNTLLIDNQLLKKVVLSSNKELFMTKDTSPKNHHLLRMYGFVLTTIEPEKTRLEEELLKLSTISQYKNLHNFIVSKTKILEEIPTKSIAFYMEKLVGDVESDGGYIKNDKEFNHMILHVIAGVITLAKHNMHHADLHYGNVMYSYKMDAKQIYYENDSKIFISESNEPRVWKIIDYGGLDSIEHFDFAEMWDSLKFFFSSIKEKEKIFGYDYNNNLAMNKTLKPGSKTKDTYNEILKSLTSPSLITPNEVPIDITYPFPA